MLGLAVVSLTDGLLLLPPAVAASGGSFLAVSVAGSGGVS